MKSEAEPARIRSRRLARDAAFQALYATVVGNARADEAIAMTANRLRLAPASEEFCRGLVIGVLDTLDDLDQRIEQYLAQGWTLPRLAATDLIALRLAVYELEHLHGIPPKVTIVEFVNLARAYGSAQSGRFVNGLLGAYLPHSAKANWDPAQEEAWEDEPTPVAEPETEPEVSITPDGDEDEEFVKAGSWVIRASDS